MKRELTESERRQQSDCQQAEPHAYGSHIARQPPMPGAEQGEISHVRARRQLDHQAGGKERCDLGPQLRQLERFETGEP